MVVVRDQLLGSRRRGQGTHLTMDIGRIIHEDKTKYYEEKGRHSRNGVNLLVNQMKKSVWGPGVVE